MEAMKDGVGGIGTIRIGYQVAQAEHDSNLDLGSSRLVALAKFGCRSSRSDDVRKRLSCGWRCRDASILA